MIKITLDKSVDSLYIYLDSSLHYESGWVSKTVVVDPVLVGGMINLDLDENGKLGGIEIIGASQKVLQSILDEAEIIG